MRQIYLVLFLLSICFAKRSAAQTVVTVNATGATGSYQTGYSDAATTRTDGDVVIAAGTKRGYAVFNLAGVVPAGATITATKIRFNFSTSTSGGGTACGIYGYAGDLSLVTTPPDIYEDCAAGSVFNSTSWGASLAGTQDLLPFNSSGILFIQSNIGAALSIGFSTSSGSNIYTITGEGGTTATQPQLQITYTPPCSGTPVAGTVHSTASSGCGTTVFTLTDSASTVGSSHQWQSSSDSVTWNNITDAVFSTYSFSGMGATTFFRCMVTCAAGGSSVPTAGIRITYGASCPCVINAGTIYSNVFSVCATTPLVLTDSAYTALGATLQWQSSPDSITWTGIPGATTGTYSTSGLTATMFYRMTFACPTSGGEVISPETKIIYGTTCPCSGTPAGGTATASTTYCSACSLTLNLSGATYGAGISYQWQMSSDGASIWADVPGATTYPFTYAPYGAYYYRCQVTCSNSGEVAYSSSVFVAFRYLIIADSILSHPSAICSPDTFFTKINGVSDLLGLKTYYGDGSHDSVTVIPIDTTSTAKTTHTYAFAGYYSVKQVLYNNNSPQDSATDYVYENLNCNILTVKLYIDVNGNCTKESTEPYNSAPVLVKVDSNGVHVATISVTSGVYYKATGPAGTIYAFSLLSNDLYASCPVSGVIYDTIQSTTVNYPTKYFGLSCVVSSPIDLSVTAVVQGSGPWRQWGHIYISNASCILGSGTVTMSFSPRYSVHLGTHPWPSAVAGNTISWNLSGLTSSVPAPVDLQFYLYHNAALLPAGDTVQDHFSVTATSGTDVNLTNNYMIIVDTIRDSNDPNEMSVSPQQCIPTDSLQLQYSIGFENVGNDTAHNVYVMDTLSDNVDPQSIRLVMASATMNVAQINDGTHNIIKFDFPGINLLDSSHHGQCDGAVIFNINRRPSLPNGADIFNHAGIFFDDNDVVMTNTVETTVGCWPAGTTTLTKTNKAEIFPNPVTDELTIKADNNTYTSFTITNTIGQQLMQLAMTGAQTKVNVKALPAGVYYVTLKGDSGSKVMKFVKW